MKKIFPETCPPPRSIFLPGTDASKFLRRLCFYPAKWTLLFFILFNFFFLRFFFPVTFFIIPGIILIKHSVVHGFFFFNQKIWILYYSVMLSHFSPAPVKTDRAVRIQ